MIVKDMSKLLSQGFRVFALSALALSCYGIAPTLAQNELSLDDFLKENEALMETPSKKKKESPIALGAGKSEDGSALPDVAETRLSVEDTGMDADQSGLRMSVDELGVIEQSEEELAEEIRQEAFDAAITGLFPLRPENIRQLLREYDTTRRAAEEPINGIPTPEVKVETISLDPGVAPMVLKTATGHITTLNILDATGAPWPIQDVGWAGDFEVVEPEEGSHIIRITPMSIAAYGNMSIRLLELQTPVTISLSTSKDEVQYRVDARIPQLGPFAQAQLIDGGSERVAGDSTLMAVLDGVPPNGATKLEVSGVDGRTTAYSLNNKTYVRTPLTLLSPGWDQSVSSADGMNVYTLNETPVLLLSDNGRFARANLTIGKDLLDE
jgi:intracellular multiplication protein IcmK